jgi:hypothetical protein
MHASDINICIHLPCTTLSSLIFAREQTSKAITQSVNCQPWGKILLTTQTVKRTHTHSRVNEKELNRGRERERVKKPIFRSRLEINVDGVAFSLAAKGEAGVEES